jgi:single-strand DNA-binding protein
MLQGFFAGNLGRDAELKDVNGQALASFSVAVTQRIKREKVTVWVNCSIWGSRAAALSAFLNKGAKVAVAGELTTRTSERNGKTYLECRVSEITLLGGGSEGGGQRSNRAAPDNDSGSARMDDSAGDDEIPFAVACYSDREMWWS